MQGEQVQEAAEEPQQKKSPLVVVRGTGRVIRKDGTVVPFHFEAQTNGFDVSNGDA